MKVKPPISLRDLTRLDRAIFSVERRRRVYGGRPLGVRRDLARALDIHPAQLSRVFSEKRVPVKWATGTAFVIDVLAAVDGLE